MLLDNGATLEAYPMFDDSHGPTGLVAAPRVIDRARDGTHLAGALSAAHAPRRQLHREAPFHVIACTAAGLDVVVGDVAPPVAFARCVFPPPPPSRAEHWRRD